MRSASDLPNADSGIGISKADVSDPYVKLHLGTQTRSTSVVWNDLDPMWEESFTFEGQLRDLLFANIRLEVSNQ